MRRHWRILTAPLSMVKIHENTGNRWGGLHWVRVVRLAIARGHQVVNVDALTYAACLDNVASVADHPNYAFEQVDIRDREGLDAVFAKHTPDAVMHLAAESPCGSIHRRPCGFYRNEYQRHL